MRTNILVLIGGLALTLAAACGDDDDSGDAGQHDSGMHGGGGGTRHDGGGGAGAMDASADSGGAGSGGHDHGGDSGAHDSGRDASDDDDAGSILDGGSDAGHDSGADSGSGACSVMCNGECCGNHQICGTVQPTTVDAAWGFGTGVSVLHVVQGSTVTFSNLGTHNVNQFPNATAFTNCDFTGLTPLATTGTYSFMADTLGDFYFGCSVTTHCANNAVKKHIIVDMPGQACVAQ